MELPNEIEWNVIKYMSHPLADVFKKELEEDLELHFHIYDESRSNDSYWISEDEGAMFAYHVLSRKLSDNNKDKYMWQLWRDGKN